MTSTDSKIHATTLASLVGLAFTVAGCASPPVAPSPALEPEAIVLATLNDEPLTLGEAMDRFLSSHAGHGVLVQGEPAVRELVGRLVEQRLFEAEAEALGLPESEELSATIEAYRRSAAENAFWQREVTDRVQVPDEDVEAFYDKTDLALKITLIEAATREAADALRVRVEAGEDMGDLAERESTHESSSFGGVLPFVRRGELESELEEAAFALEEPGDLAPVVETAAGFAFVQLVERIENPMRPPREVALPQIRSILEERRQDELRAEVEARIDAEAGVKIDETLLGRDVLLGTETPDAVVASAADKTLALEELRGMLNLDAIRAAADERVQEVVPEIVGQWTRKHSVALAVDESGLLEDPEIDAATEAIRKDTLLSLLYRDYVYAGIELTEDQLREYYETHKETEFTRPAEVRLAYIVVAEDGIASEVVERAKNGEDFENLAREFSIDPRSAVHGGRIGWVREGQLVKEVEEPSFAAAAGDLVGPVPTELGQFIVKILEKKDPQLVSFEQARNVARKRLAKQVRGEVYAQWAEKLRERAAIEVNADGVQQAVAWLEEEAARIAAIDAEEKAAAEAAGLAPSPHQLDGPIPLEDATPATEAQEITPEGTQS